MTNRRARPEGHPNWAGRAALAVSGALSSLAGLIVAAGGDLSPERSALDLFAGVGLVTSGFLLSLRHRAAAWTYTLAFAGAAGWSLRNMIGGRSAEQQAIRNPAVSERGSAAPDAPLHPVSERVIERTSAMIYDWQTSLRTGEYCAARILPPVTVGETGWDILLALHSDRHWRLSPRKLAAMVSVPDGTIDRWLGSLEERKLITGAHDPSTDKVLAVLTETGGDLLERYFSATKELQAGGQS